MLMLRIRSDSGFTDLARLLPLWQTDRLTQLVPFHTTCPSCPAQAVGKGGPVSIDQDVFSSLFNNLELTPSQLPFSLPLFGLRYHCRWLADGGVRRKG